ncbi:AAA family ATPase [Protofrankia coriariae]|nr:LuxR family transcriptional regulator [Protofrankia coriariae]
MHREQRAVADRLSPAPADLPPAAWPLIGRDTELDALTHALTGAAPHSVIIVGPAGVGKTRLAREAMLIAAAAGHEARWVTATRSVARAPFGAFAPLLAVPEPRDGLGPADSFEGLLRRTAYALVNHGGVGRLLLFVDDAQLLDEASAGLIQQLVSADAVLVVATVRAEEPTPAAVTSLWKDDLAIRLRLSDLADSVIDDLLTVVLGDQVDRATVAELTARCQGNVLFLRELVRGALADGTLVRHGGVWRMTGAPAPSDRIVEFVGARLAGLSPDARALLELTAYGEPLGGAELDALGDERLVEKLEREGLLVSAFDSRRLQIRLGHPIYADVLRAQTSAVRVGAMARALATIVERTGCRRRDDLLRIGLWRLDGGGGQPDVLLEAARAARWHYDFPLAERLARAAVEAGTGFDGRLLAAQTAALQGRGEAAEQDLAELAGCVANDEERARAAIARIDVLWLSLGRMQDGLRIAEDAEATIADVGLRTEVSSHRAGLVLGSEGPRAAVRVLEPLLAEARGRSLVWMGVVGAFSLGRLGRLREGLDLADRAYAAGVTLTEPDDWYPWFNLHGRCELLVQAGRFVDAERLAREQHQRGLDEGSSEARAWFLWNLSRTVRDRGNVRTATRDAREAATLLHRLGRLGVQHTLLSLLAQAQALAGDAAAARRSLAAIDALGIEQPRWSWTDHLAAQAWTAVAEGRITQGRDLLARATQVGEQIGDRTGAAAALHDIGRLGTPRRVVDHLVALARELEGDLVAARAAHVVALAEDDPRALDAVATTFEHLDAELLAAEAAADAAVAWRRAGDVHRADAGLHRAAALAARCKGAVTPALAPIESRVQLTDAERETALLAAAGHTDRDIAAELQLSVRTVGNRLQRIYHKLGVSRRTDLARFLR